MAVRAFTAAGGVWPHRRAPASRAACKAAVEIVWQAFLRSWKRGGRVHVLQLRSPHAAGKFLLGNSR